MDEPLRGLALQDQVGNPLQRLHATTAQDAPLSQ
jgi:hypothetical protein